jgi:glycosidase
MQIARPPWWQTATIYQVYPRSFQDSDGDGVGDLRGLASRLSYLAELGIDAIWLSPIFRSPMKDFGYDISNYVDIDPMFGTMADFDTLLAAAHEQGLRLLLDLVPNHTSDQHPWFVESRSSRRNANGTSGAIRRRMEGHPTIGYRNSAGAPGSSMPLPNSTTITPSLPSSPT